MVHEHQDKVDEMISGRREMLITARTVAETVYRAILVCSEDKEHFFVPGFYGLYKLKNLDTLFGNNLSGVVKRYFARL